MSGFRKTEPTAGASPPGRKTRAVSGNSAKRAALESVWSRKVWSTTKPLRAIRSAGLRSVPRRSLPQRSAARAHVAGVPGTPTERPEVMTVANGHGCPVAGSMKDVSVYVAGAVSRPSIVSTSPLAASRWTKKPPPPMPVE